MNGRDTKELEQLKSLSLKIQEATSKSFAITDTKGKKYFTVRQIIYIDQGHLSRKVTPVIDFKDEAIIQWEVPVIENTFVSRWLQINDKNNK